MTLVVASFNQCRKVFANAKEGEEGASQMCVLLLTRGKEWNQRFNKMMYNARAQWQETLDGPFQVDAAWIDVEEQPAICTSFLNGHMKDRAKVCVRSSRV